MTRSYKPRQVILEPAAGTLIPGVGDTALVIAPAGGGQVLFEAHERSAPGVWEPVCCLQFPAVHIAPIFTEAIAATGETPTGLMRRVRARTAPGSSFTASTVPTPSTFPAPNPFTIKDAYGDTLTINAAPSSRGTRVDFVLSAGEDTVKVTLTDTRLVQAFVTAGEASGMSAEVLGREALKQGAVVLNAPPNRSARRRTKAPPADSTGRAEVG